MTDKFIVDTLKYPTKGYQEEVFLTYTRPSYPPKFLATFEVAYSPRIRIFKEKGG